SVLNRAPVPPVRLNPDVPAELEQIINKALEKDRDVRCQSAAELRADLKRLRRDIESSRKVSTAAPAGAATTTQAVPETTQTSSSAVIAAAKQHKLGVAAGVFAALIVLGAAGFGVYSLLHRPAPMPFQKFTVTQVTNTGKATQAALSPDGRYVLSVMDDDGMQSLWLHNLPTDSDTQVIPPSDSTYSALTFSPNGNYIYFLKDRKLYRSTILGGAPQIVIQNIGAFAFSLDGQRIAYIRVNPEGGEWRIFAASVDGSNETVLRTGSHGSGTPRSLAWSPTGAEIAFAMQLVAQGGGAIGILDARRIAS